LKLPPFHDLRMEVLGTTLEKQREGLQVYPGEPGSDRFFSDLGNSW